MRRNLGVLSTCYNSSLVLQLLWLNMRLSNTESNIGERHKTKSHKTKSRPAAATVQYLHHVGCHIHSSVHQKAPAREGIVPSIVPSGEIIKKQKKWTATASAAGYHRRKTNHRAASVCFVQRGGVYRRLLREIAPVILRCSAVAVGPRDPA